VEPFDGVYWKLVSTGAVMFSNADKVTALTVPPPVKVLSLPPLSLW